MPDAREVERLEDRPEKGFIKREDKDRVPGLGERKKENGKVGKKTGRFGPGSSS